MKGLKYLIAILLFIPTVVFAAGSVTVSKNNLTIKPGGKASFVVKANNAAGKVDISSSDSSVATVSTSSVWLDNDSKTITVTGKSEGTANITVRLTDVASYDGAVLNNTYTVKITVKAPEVDNRSGNNNLSSISVEGYDLVTVDEEHYSLTVKNSVGSIIINATAEDSKASIDGIGSKELAVGENIFEIVVTAENGNKKTYEIAVTRKDDKYFLEDIDDALLNDSPVSIILNSGDLISKEIVDKIIESKKTVYFNVYNDNKIIYSWIIDGNKVTESEDIYTELVFEPKEKDEFGKKTNYADGLYVKVLNNKFGAGISTRIYVGDKYEDGDFLKAYTGEDLSLTEESLKVENGYVEIVPNNEVYFFTKSSLEKDSKSKSKNNKVFIIISIVEALVIVGLIASKFIKPKKKEEKPIEKTEEEKNTLPEETKEEETPIDFPSSQL